MYEKTFNHKIPSTGMCYVEGGIYKRDINFYDLNRRTELTNIVKQQLNGT